MVVGLPAVVGSIALTLNESLLLLIILSDLKSSIATSRSNQQGMKSKIEKKSKRCGSKLGKFHEQGNVSVPKTSEYINLLAIYC